MIVKSIISVFTAGVILFSSAFTPVAKAGLVEDLANSYTQSSFSKFVMNGSFVAVGTGIGTYFGSPQIGAMVGEAVALGFNDVVEWYAAGHTDDEVYDAFDQYVSSLPFAGYNSDGSFMLPIPVVRFANGYSDAMPPQWTAQSSGNSYTASGVMYGSENGLYVYPEKVYAPVAGFYTFVHEFSGTGGASVRSESYYIKSRTHADVGFDIIGAGGQDGRIYIYGTSRDNSCFVSGRIWYKVEPDVPLSGDTYSIETRPTSIVGDYGIIGDNGTIIHIEGNKIVDEDGKTVYNPATGSTQGFTDYTYDYSDRSYLLTLEDGNTIKVVYGNENITIHEGDTIYNVYYLIPDGTGSGDDSGDTPGGEDMSWWKEAWTNFTDKLFAILGNGGSSVNPDNSPSVPDDDESGDKGYSIIDLFVILKDGTWSFITGIVTTAYDGFTGFVESVSSAGSFFTFYNEESEDSLVFIPLEGGETIWD